MISKSTSLRSGTGAGGELLAGEVGECTIVARGPRRQRDIRKIVVSLIGCRTDVARFVAAQRETSQRESRAERSEGRAEKGACSRVRPGPFKRCSISSATEVSHKPAEAKLASWSFGRKGSATRDPSSLYDLRHQITHQTAGQRPETSLVPGRLKATSTRPPVMQS